MDVSLDSEIKITLDEVLLRDVLGRYSSRTLGITSKDDVVQLHSSLRQGWYWIVDHYRRIGLIHSYNVIWDDDFKVLNDFPGFPVSFYFFGDEANKIRPNEEWFDIVSRMNSKNEFIETAKKLSVSIPRTFCFNSKSEIQDCRDFNFPVFLKLSVAVSGIGVIKCDSSISLEKSLDQIKEGIEIQLQEAILGNNVEILSAQYLVDAKNSLRFLMTAEQVLDGYKYIGVRTVTRHNLYYLTKEIARYMYLNGMKGHFGFDILAVPRSSGGYGYFVIECNPRYTGVSYAMYIAFKLGAKEWMAKEIQTTISDINFLELGDIEYDPCKKQGVIVVNWGMVVDGEIGVLIIADSHKKQLWYLSELEKIL